MCILISWGRGVVGRSSPSSLLSSLIDSPIGGTSEAGRMEEGFPSLLLLPWHLTGKAQVVPRAAVGAYLKFCHDYTSWGSSKSQPASPAPTHLKLWVLSAMPLNFTISHSASALLPLSSSNTWLTVLLVYLYIRIILSAKVIGVSSSPDLNLNEHLCLSNKPLSLLSVPWSYLVKITCHMSGKGNKNGCHRNVVLSHVASKRFPII